MMSCKFFFQTVWENKLLTFPHSVLSSSALDALKEFYAERDARAEQFAKLQQKAEEQHAAAGQQKLSMEAFTEDWNESQFWVREVFYFLFFPKHFLLLFLPSS